MSLSELHKQFKAWKPIHLCWLFRKLGLPIPPYLVGSGDPVLDQRDYILADDDPSTASDPDSCTFDAVHTPRTAQSINDPFHIRIQVANDGTDNLGNVNWQLWYDKDNTPSTATQVTTTSSEIQITESVGGEALADNDAVNTRKCGSQAETWMDGLYLETSDETGKLDVVDGYYTEFQFCVKFISGASGTYYFFGRQEGTVFNGTHDQVPEVTAAVSDEEINVSESPSVADSVTPAMGDFSVNVADCPKPMDKLR